MTNQDRHSAAFPRWDRTVHPRRRGNLAAAHRGERWGDGRYLPPIGGFWPASTPYPARRYRLGTRCRAPGGGVAAACGGGFPAGRSSSMFSPPGWFRRSRKISAAASVSKSAAPSSSAPRTAAPRCVCAISWCATRTEPWSRARRRRKSDVSGMSLLSGHMRAESLNLVGAALAVRIEPDGSVTVFASGADKHPIATASVPAGRRPLRIKPSSRTNTKPTRPPPSPPRAAMRRSHDPPCRGRRATASPRFVVARRHQPIRARRP